MKLQRPQNSRKDRKSYFKILSLLILILCLTTNSFSEAEEKFPYIGIITADAVNIRSGANPNFEILCKLNKGSFITIAGRSLDWYKIKLPKEAYCYVNSDYIEVKDIATGIIKADRVNIRAREGQNYNILAQINKGDKVELIEKVGDWYKIEPTENCFGWVHSDFVKYFSRIEEVKLGKKKEEIKEEVKFQQPLKEEPIKKEPITKEEKEVPIATGRIEDLGRIMNRPGTHKLVKDGSVIYYLKGDRSQLDSLNFYEVRVWGEVTKRPNCKYPLIIVKKIEPLRGDR